MDACKFKIGDKIICTAKNHTTLVYNKIYIVTTIETIEGFDQGCDETIVNGYFLWRFESIKEHRKRKLEKIQKVKL
jgi:hypothetical protein